MGKIPLLLSTYPYDCRLGIIHQEICSGRADAWELFEHDMLLATSRDLDQRHRSSDVTKLREYGPKNKAVQLGNRLVAAFS